MRSMMTNVGHAMSQVVDDYSGQAFRLLAIAGRRMRKVGHANFGAMTLQQVESRAGPLDLLGLFVLSNHLRPDTKEAIAHLQNM